MCIRDRNYTKGARTILYDDMLYDKIVENNSNDIVEVYTKVNKYYIECNNIIPVSYTHLDVYKRQGTDHILLLLCS